MNMHQLQRWLQLLLLGTVISVVVMTARSQERSIEDPVGKVLVVAGEAMYAQDEQGQQRGLVRGSHVFVGDTLVMGEGRAQVRFFDRAVVSLDARSRLHIRRYFQNTANREDGSWLDLLKGGFKTITGLIAEKKPDKYKLTTPVATIGVRGTVITALCASTTTCNVVAHGSDKATVKLRHQPADEKGTPMPPGQWITVQKDKIIFRQSRMPDLENNIRANVAGFSGIAAEKSEKNDASVYSGVVTTGSPGAN